MTRHPFAGMMALPRWLNWRAVPNNLTGKTTKIPILPTSGHVCDAIDPAHHFDYAIAHARHIAKRDGIAFAVMADDPYWVIDIDGCADLRSSNGWSDIANILLGMLPGCAVEISQSGKGLHLFGRGVVPDHACKNIALGLEFYTDARFIAVTFNGAMGDCDSDHSAAIAQIVETYFAPNIYDVADWTDAPCAGWDQTLADDAALIDRATRTGENNDHGARFGLANSKATFSALYNANADALAVAFPSDSTDGYDSSSADMALANHLAWWTGHNCERMQSLMLASALLRDKWLARPEYLQSTILQACGLMAGKFAKPREGSVLPIAAQEAGFAPLPVGKDLLTVADQSEYFANCVYVLESNKVWTPHSPIGLDKARFDAYFGGPLFTMRHDGSKTEKSAWTAFTQNGQYRSPKADTYCFRPKIASGSIIDIGGTTAVNCYLPVHTARQEGDASPFEKHLRLITGPDYDIALAYMASMVRNIGHKNQYDLVMCGAEGNGKTFLAYVMRHCIGECYTAGVNPQVMKKTANQFNGYVKNNLLLFIEEIFVGNNTDFLDGLKETITNTRIPVESKGVDQKTYDNCINLMLFTNRRGAIPINVNTRRHCIIDCPQQTYADCLRDGLTEDYFRNLYNWMKGEGDWEHLGSMGGAAIAHNFLLTCDIAEKYNPSTMAQRAPRTSSFEQSIRLSHSPVEQEVIYATQEDMAGFAGGFISTHALDNLLRIKGYRVSRNGQAELLEKLGYVLHPSLIDGKTGRAVSPDNARTRLYTLVDHLSWQLIEPTTVATAYERAQQTVTDGDCAIRR